MKKLIAMTALVLISSQAFAGDFVITTGQSLNVTTILPTASSLGSIATTADVPAKELMIAAHEDAVECVRTQGAYQSALLDAAFEKIDAMGGAQLNVVEKAEAVIQLAEQP